MEQPVVIKFEGIKNDTLIWQHPIEKLGYNAIIIVRENTEAMFIKNGQILEVFSQPGEYKVNEKKEGFFSKFKKEIDPLLDCQVYFVNKSAEQIANWGTPSRIDFIESQTGIRASVGACGTYKIAISNARKILGKIMGLSNQIDMDKIAEYFKVEVSSTVKNGFAQLLIVERKPYYELAANEITLSNRLKNDLNKIFDEYGLKVTNFSIKNISFSDNLKEKLTDLDLQQYIKIVKSNNIIVNKPIENKVIKKNIESEILRPAERPIEKQIEIQNIKPINLAEGICSDVVIEDKTNNKKIEPKKMLLLDGDDEEIISVKQNSTNIDNYDINKETINDKKENIDLNNETLLKNPELKKGFIICPLCGAENTVTMKFCGECGQKINKV